MKLDINYLKDILLYLQNSEKCDVFYGCVLEYLGYSMEIDDFEMLENKANPLFIEREKIKSKIIFHIKILYEIQAINCNVSNLGFYAGENLEITKKVYYNITHKGIKLLEAMLNNTLWSKFKDKVGIITKETLSQAPALTVSIILELIK